jgi:hypothetical protein
MKHQRTTPKTPEAWLLVRQGHAIGAFPSAFDPELLAMRRKERDPRNPLTVVRDEPSLQVNYYGLLIQNPSWLTARDNWFQRYSDILESHLRDPAQATVYTLAPGRLTDPLMTHKSSRKGPFPFPRGKEWPRCGLCGARLGCFGVMDFRKAADSRIPRGALVLHGCAEHGHGVVSDHEAWAITWIKEGDDLEIRGNSRKKVLVGTPWQATEYPLPLAGAQPSDLVDSGPFLDEYSLHFNFSCFADKVGGHVFWIQPRDDLWNEPSYVSENGEPMMYIGQFTDSPDIEIGDCGLVYLLYSPRTGETIIEAQCF